MNATIADLLTTADRLLTAAPAATPAGRHRGAAFALRAALELAVGAALAAAPQGISGGSNRAKFLCLRGCAEAETARRAKALWALLCLGCHYHQYEIGPTRDQVRSWREEVGAVIALLGG